MKTRISILIFIVSLAISLLIAPLRSGFVSIGEISGFKLSSLVGLFIYTGLTYYFLKRFSAKLPVWLICLLVVLGLAALTLPIRILNFRGTLASSLEPLIHIWGVLLALISYKIPVLFKLPVVILGLIIGCWLSIQGYNYWIHKVGHGTFTAQVKPQSMDLSFQTDKGDSLSVSTFKGSYLLLDCWYTKCAYCYEKFPELQQLYEQELDKTGLLIYALHSRLKDENFASGKNILQRRGYTFPCLSIDINDEQLRQIGVLKYPTVLLFNPAGELIAKGNQKMVIDFMVKNGIITK